ncbi:MAG: methyltransferase domain-containing protein [Candidatus Norongarragalinales archaeon]
MVGKGFFKNRFYKLLRLANGETTLEIDGVRMHQTKNKTPLKDARDKTRALGVKNGAVVMDVCTGLGYSAIACAKAGAAKVYTIEKDTNVLEIAKQNRFSKELFSNPKIEIVNKDALQAVAGFPNEFFDFILHDPPRLSHAGELYSLSFYRELYRVLKNCGRLFHYTGTPGAARGKNIPKGVKQRLAEAGFQKIVWVEGCLGFVASK